MFGKSDPPRGYRFTDGCRASLQAARNEANRLGNPYVGTEHILLALVAQTDSEPARILTALGLKLGYVRNELEGVLAKERGSKAPRVDLPYTSHAKAVLEAAMREAAASAEYVVGYTQLLLGVMANPRSRAAQILQRLGATQEDVRTALRGAPRPRVDFRIRIDDKSNSLIYQQIVDQIKEAIATGRLRAGDRLPTVRQLADDIDIAPGTVARAYSELESSGIVVTDGARGTSVALPGRRAGPSGRKPVEVRELLRSAVVAAYHLGVPPDELRAALEQAMMDVFPDAA